MCSPKDVPVTSSSKRPAEELCGAARRWFRRAADASSGESSPHSSSIGRSAGTTSLAWSRSTARSARSLGPP